MADKRDRRDIPLGDVTGAIFVGVVAARNLAARGETRPLQALEHAKALKAKGASESRIYAETNAILANTEFAGVSYGADGKARFEISDANARLKPAALDRSGKGVMGEFLVHPTYYAAHPEAAHLAVEKRGASGAGYDGTRVLLGDNQFSPSLLAGRLVARASAKGVVGHELNHHAQDTEGFAPGGSPKDFEGKFPGPHNEALRKMMYRSLAGEVEAENTRARLNMTAAERRAVHPDKTAAIPRSKQIVTDAHGRVQPRIQEMAEDIKDIGQKLGGARKDRAVKTGPKPKMIEPADTRPGWQKRFVAAQTLARGPDGKSVPSGQWTLLDTRKTSRWGSKSATRQTFPSQAAAEAAIPLVAVSQKHRVRESYAIGPDGKTDTSKTSYEIWRTVSDRKAVKAVNETFTSREAAMQHMVQNAERLLGSARGYGEEILARPDKVIRKGEEFRKGDIAPEAFHKEFGFRGVEFGHWQNERQGVMNHAYDGLRDLAKITGLSPNAISLNNELGLAFGARGHGGNARAHYELNYQTINLTKLSGAGSLAHEWWHAVDHHLAQKNDPRLAEKTVNKAGDTVVRIADAHALASNNINPKTGQLAENVRVAYKDLIDTMLMKPEQVTLDNARLDRAAATAKGELKSRLDSIRADLASQKTYGKRFTAPASAEQLAEFDRHASKLLAGEDLKTSWRLNDSAGPTRAMRSFGGRHTNDTLEAMSKVLKEVRGRSGFDSQNQQGPLDSLRRAMTSAETAMKVAAEAKAQPVATRMVETDFARNARNLDQGRTTNYWSERHEMAARAFSAYIEDKIYAKGEASHYLSFGSDNRIYGMLKGNEKPFPEGAERAAINQKFDKLIDAMKAADVVKADPALKASMTMPAGDGNGKPQGWSDAARAAIAEVRAADAKPKAAPAPATTGESSTPKRVAKPKAEPKPRAAKAGDNGAPKVKIKYEPEPGNRRIGVLPGGNKVLIAKAFRDFRAAILHPDRKGGAIVEKSGFRNITAAKAWAAAQHLALIEKPHGPQGWSDAAREASAKVRHDNAKPSLPNGEKANPGYANQAERKPAPSIQSAVERAMAMQEAKRKTPQQSTLGKPAEQPRPNGERTPAKADAEGRLNQPSRTQARSEFMAKAEVKVENGTHFVKAPGSSEWVKTGAGNPTAAKAVVFAKTAPSTLKSVGGHLLAPVAIGAAALIAMNESAKAGETTSGQLKAGATEAGKGAAVMGGFIAGTAAATKGLMKAGMKLVAAAPVVQAALIAGGAAHGAITAKPGERLKGAAKGAFDMSAPGMIWNTGVAVKEAAKSTSERVSGPTRMSEAQTEKFNEANAAYKAMQEASQSQAKRKPGWSNEARIKAAQAQGKALPYQGDQARGPTQWITRGKGQ